jgi:hypothetical protein
MPLHDLVGYFNGRFGREHHSSYRPFVLKDGQVSGLFGPIRIDSHFSPIRQTKDPTAIIGHSAKIEVSTCATPYLGDEEIENLLANKERQPTSLESIINFDRLSRTVHMLNFLPLMPAHGYLFLEVDPRHILGIKHDHGVYFGEVIAQCGLNAHYIVIVLSVHSQYARYYKELLAGLDNYRRQGYQVALKVDYKAKDETVLDLIVSLSPNFVSVSSNNLGQRDGNNVQGLLDELTTVVASVNGQSLLQKVDQKKTDSLARKANFDLVEGSYYRAIAFDYSGNLEAGRHY